MENRMTFEQAFLRMDRQDNLVWNACNPETVTIHNHCFVLEANLTSERVANLFALGINLEKQIDRLNTKEPKHYMIANVREMYIKLRM